MVPEVYFCLRCNRNKKLKECPTCGFTQLCPEHFNIMKKYCCNFCKRFQTFLFPHKIADLDYSDGYNIFRVWVVQQKVAFALISKMLSGAYISAYLATFDQHSLYRSFKIQRLLS